MPRMSHDDLELDRENELRCDLDYVTSVAEANKELKKLSKEEIGGSRTLDGLTSAQGLVLDGVEIEGRLSLTGLPPDERQKIKEKYPDIRIY